MRTPTKALLLALACGSALSFSSAARAESCPCDFDRSGTLTSSDFFSFLQDWFDARLAADYTRDGIVDSADFFGFLSCYFAGCPSSLMLGMNTDLMQTDSASINLAIPPDFFGPGSDPFTGALPLVGLPIGTGGPFEIGTTDFTFMRVDMAMLADAPSSSNGLLVQLGDISLRSASPITVNVGGSPQQWDVRVALDGVNPLYEGTIDFLRASTNAGSFALNFPGVRLLVTFTSGAETRTLPIGPFLLAASNGSWIDDGSCPGALELPHYLPSGPCFTGSLSSSVLSTHFSPAQPDPSRPPPIIMPGANVSPDVASIGRDAVISPGAIISAGAVIGPRAFIGPNAFIGIDSLVGADSVIGADASLGNRAIVCGSSTIGTGCTLGEETVVSTGCTVGIGTSIGSHVRIDGGSSIGNLVVIHPKSTLAGSIQIGDGATIPPHRTLFNGTVVPPGSTPSEDTVLCMFEDGTMQGLTVSACETAGGVVYGGAEGGDDISSPTPVAGTRATPVPWNPAMPPAGLENLQRDVNSAGSTDRRGAIKDRAYDGPTYNCQNFTTDMFTALQAAGYTCTWTYMVCWTANPAHDRWNWIWTKGNIWTGAHARNDIHINNQTIWVEPQTGQVGVNMDFDADGVVTYATGSGSRLTDGNKRIEVYNSLQAARDAGRLTR